MTKLLRHEKHLSTLVKVAVLKAAAERWYRLSRQAKMWNFPFHVSHDCRDYPNLCGSKCHWPEGHKKVPLNVRGLLQGKYQPAACRHSHIPVLQPTEQLCRSSDQYFMHCDSMASLVRWELFFPPRISNFLRYLPVQRSPYFRNLVRQFDQQSSIQFPLTTFKHGPIK